MTSTLPETNSLISHLKRCIQRQLTGRLEIYSASLSCWQLYFFMGRLVRAEGGEHPLRRWRRYLSQYRPQSPAASDAGAVRSELQQPERWDYATLAQLVEQHQLLREQAIKVIEATLIEVLFDILQQEERSRLNIGEALSYRIVPDNPDQVAAPLLPAGIRYLWQQAQQQWQTWVKAGFTTRSPNLAPVIKSPKQFEALAQQSRGLRSLIDVINGQRTLRDIAIKLGHSPLLLLKFLMPYVGRGVIDLLPIGDLRAPASLKAVAQPSPLAAQLTRPLIAYVEDSALYRQVMGDILAELGYQFLGIPDPLKTLPILLEHQPELVFLDLVMPIVNGYEICAQIRRVPDFKQMPVVIVTSSDTFVDRVRAKIVGASDFLPKPINPQRVLHALKKHLPD
ncbi:MAG: response regulator [Leptolyngbya sp. SIO4C1]|nr:response regulator [Leptolyngbya sp. SIO4C1]